MLVLPLVGTIDHRRSSLILERLLGSVVETSSDRVILDVTGMTRSGRGRSGLPAQGRPDGAAALALGVLVQGILAGHGAGGLRGSGSTGLGVETFRDLRAGLKAAIAVRQRAPAAAKPA